MKVEDAARLRMMERRDRLLKMDAERVEIRITVLHTNRDYATNKCLLLQQMAENLKGQIELESVNLDHLKELRVRAAKELTDIRAEIERAATER